MKYNATIEWTQELTDAVAERWRNDVPATEIADEFGLTKNMVIGRMRRIGAKRALKVPRPKPVSVLRTTPKIKALPPSTADEPRHVNIFDLGRRHCLAVMDQRCPSTNLPLYCGAPRLETSSYCAAHEFRYSPGKKP